MRRRPPLTSSLLSIILLLTLVLPVKPCERHRHFDARIFASRQEETDTSSANGPLLAAGIVATIVIGVVVLFLVVFVLMVCIYKRNANRETPNRETPNRETPYLGFADWRKDRNLTSVELDRRNVGKSVNIAEASEATDRARAQGSDTV